MVDLKSYMKIIILHGENINKSYLRLTKFITEAKKRDWEILYDEVSVTPSLFSKERLIVLRDYKLYKPRIDFAGTLVIYHESNLPSAFLKSLPQNSKLERFDLPKAIWSFLNHPTLKMFHEVLKSEPIEFVFIMLFRTLKKQKRYDLIGRMAQIDIDYKTGKADLESSLDLMLAKYIH